MVPAMCAASLACLLCIGVAIHEWNYHQAHRYATGPSASITVLAIAGALVAGVVAYIAYAFDKKEHRDFRTMVALATKRDG